MSVTVVVLIVVGILFLTGAVVLSVRAGPRRHERSIPEVADAARDARDWPSPGGPTPTRHGEPMPGSEPDRRRHGKP